MALTAYTKTVYLNGQAPARNDTNLNNTEDGVEAVTNEAILHASYISDLQAGGISIKTVTTTHTTALTESILLCDATSAAFTVTLPSPSTCYNGVNLTSLVYTISKIDVSANAVTIATLGAETIGGDASFDLLYINEALELITDGTNWYIKG